MVQLRYHSYRSDEERERDVEPETRTYVPATVEPVTVRVRFAACCDTALGARAPALRLRLSPARWGHALQRD